MTKKIYWMATPSNSDEYVETPPSLYVELTDEVIAKIEAVAEKMASLKYEYDMVVYGADILHWGVDSHSAFVSETEGALQIDEDYEDEDEGLVTVLPELDEEEMDNADYRIDSRGFRVDESNVQMIAWSKWSNLKMTTGYISIVALKAAYEKAKEQA